MIQLGKFVGGGVADNNYLYPARWGWINISLFLTLIFIYAIFDLNILKRKFKFETDSSKDLNTHLYSTKLKII